MADPLSSFVRLKPGVEWQPVDDEVVVLDLATSSYLAVNDTAAVLWPLVAAGATEMRLVDELTRQFQVEAASAEADVSAFVERLRSLALVVDEP
jgi:hypothetical protein